AGEVQPDKIQVTSLGGATEASIWSILYPIDEVDPTWDSIPYGRPMTNQQFYVLNSKMASCPVWVPGALYIGGKGLAKGYWKEEEKTNSRFILHPQTRERLYHTGDIGYYLPDGNIKFLGREDTQVKIRGHRIELGEIEATLERYPGVRQAFTKITGEKTGPKRLYAYVVAEEGHESALFTKESADAAAHQLLMGALRETGRQQSAKMPAEFGQLSGLIDSFNRISTAYIIQALRKLGAYHQAGEHYTIDELTARFNIQPRYRSLAAHWLAELRQDGLLQKTPGEGYSNLRALPVSSPENLWKTIDSFHGLAESKSTLLSYIKNCGENLPALLTGQIDPLEIFFKGGSRETAEELYQFNPFSEYINLLARDVLVSIVQNRHSSKELNILEVGAGTGGTTAYLLPVLDPGRSHYTFTDISSFFIGPAKEKFAQYDFVSYDLFNAELDPSSQGYALHSYDVIVAADVLHNVKDLSLSLEYLRSLLVPGGILLLIEPTRNMRLQMITIGLLEEFTKSDGGGLPFLSIEAWQQALAAGGYEGWDIFPAPN
ncbi:MAG: methyltransferase, partial [Bacteroidota bacterium]